jgi:hypothetical protein
MVIVIIHSSERRGARQMVRLLLRLLTHTHINILQRMGERGKLAMSVGEKPT